MRVWPRQGLLMWTRADSKVSNGVYQLHSDSGVPVLSDVVLARETSSAQSTSGPMESESLPQGELSLSLHMSAFKCLSIVQMTIRS